MVSDAEVGAGLRVTSAAKLREILMPRVDLHAVDDRGSTTRNSAVVIDLLSNDVGAEGAEVALGTPTRGTVSLTSERKARYTPPTGYVGEDSFAYTLTRGARSSTASVSVSAQNAGAWGPGPRSGDRWWTGFGLISADNLSIVERFERMRNRPVDIVTVFPPKTKMKDWDDLAGGLGDDETEIGGAFTLGVNNMKVIWEDSTVRTLPVHLCVVLAPPREGNQHGRRPELWWDYAAGAYDVYWRRFGKRLAHLDDRYGRTAPSSSTWAGSTPAPGTPGRSPANATGCRRTPSSPPPSRAWWRRSARATAPTPARTAPTSSAGVPRGSPWRRGCTTPRSTRATRRWISWASRTTSATRT